MSNEDIGICILAAPMVGLVLLVLWLEIFE